MTATEAKTSLLKWIHVFPNFVAFILTCWKWHSGNGKVWHVVKKFAEVLLTGFLFKINYKNLWWFLSSNIECETQQKTRRTMGKLGENKHGDSIFLMHFSNILLVVINCASLKFWIEHPFQWNYLKWDVHSGQWS